MIVLPWKKPKSVYSDAGPDAPVEFRVENVSFQVRPVDSQGRDTGRRRYFVACVECDCILHDATTGPVSYIQGHMREKHGFKGEIEYVG
jgi:hypothetical protein